MVDDDDIEGDPLLGRVIDGRFTLQSVLGRGGMGVVYKAHQASLERSVALKLMTGVPPERENEFQRRFFLEAATSAKLKHPNTITVFDYGSSLVDDNRVFFIAMELLEGQPLQKLLAKGRVLAPLRAVHIALQICRSLREAHKAGVVHRDLKPGNVMIVKQDEGDDVDGDFVKVLDFGLAKVGTHDLAKPIEGLTKAGTFMGSPRYVAPEQVEGRPVDARADIYSLGCILFRMLSGRVPYDGKAPVEIMLKHLNDPVPKMGVAGLPLSLDRLVNECLAKEAAERPASMDAVMQRLKLVRAELGGTGSGIMVVSDDRFSQPPASIDLSLSDPKAPASAAAVAVVDPAPVPLATRVDRRTPASGMLIPAHGHGGQPEATPLGRSIPRGFDEVSRVAKPRQRTDSALANTAPTLGPGFGPGFDDSTRPTSVLGKLTIERRPQTQRPWAGIAAGVVVGLLACVGLVSWRLGVIDTYAPVFATWLQTHGVLDAPALAPAAASSSSSSSSAVTGPLAKRAFIRITTDPAGADVLEVQDGLPKLLGVTPLTVPWDVEKMPRPRELLLRKEGFKPSAATLVPPAQNGAQPVWLDVDAALRAR